MNDFGKKFKDLLQEQGMTQATYAKLVGQDPSHVSHIVANRRQPSFKELQKLKEIFPNADLNDMIQQDDNVTSMVAEDAEEYTTNTNSKLLLEQVEELLKRVKSQL